MSSPNSNRLPADPSPPRASVAAGTRHNRALWGCSVCGLLAVVISGISPYDRLTWWLEIAPILIVLPLLWATQRRFRLTPMLYGLIATHALVLALGGAYTYARVPLGEWLADLLGTERNPYDKVGHFFQGLVPALVAREMFVRGQLIRGSKMLIWAILSSVLAISAIYELLEWWAAVALGQGADAFLGTQGDPWDTQSDMFLALLGGLTAITCFAPWQDRQFRLMRAGREACSQSES